ncbi:MAG: hypothetical protein FWE58_00870 [Methanobrevibacter sp.]|nr:hypothetical protein [Methanobrevibacter sp.]
MGLFGNEPKTPEKELVDKLVGSGFVWNIAVSNLDIETNDKDKLQKTVKKAWKNGASCEKIQRVYDRKLSKIKKRYKDREGAEELADRLVGIHNFLLGGSNLYNLASRCRVDYNWACFYQGTVQNSQGLNKNEYISFHDVRNKIKKVLKNKGTCEEIQYAYDEIVYPYKIKSKKLVYKLLGKDPENTIGGKLATLGLEKRYANEVRSKVLKTWKKNENDYNLESLALKTWAAHDNYTDMLQKSYDEAVEEIKIKQFVHELVGEENREIDGKLTELNLTHDQKNEIKESIINFWKSGGSKEKIEEIYNINKERLSKGASSISKDLYDFMKKGITLYAEKTEQKVVPTTQTVQHEVVKDEYGNLTRMGATMAIGLAGMALTSGKKTETVEKEISTTKVVNKKVKEKALEIIPSGESLRISKNEQVFYVERIEIKEYNENFKDIILNNGNVIPLDIGQDFNSNGLKEYIKNGPPSDEDMIYFGKIFYSVV